MRQQLSIAAILFVLIPFWSLGQGERNGIPFSFTASSDLIALLQFESFEAADPNTLILEDAENNADNTKAHRFAWNHTAELNPSNSGRWFTQPNGDRVWLLGITCEDALALGITFGTFDLPEGARMFIFSEDHDDVAGSFSESENNVQQQLSVRPVAGDRIVVEYYEPLEVRGLGQINIRTVSQVYRMMEQELWDDLAQNECYVNPVCSPARDFLEQASATVRITTDDGSKFCNGVLINQSNSKKKPYVLTHSSALEGDPAAWRFTFNHFSQDCDNTLASEADLTVVGAGVVKHDVEHGVLLLELNNSPHNDWDVYYSGWDRVEAAPRGCVSVLHPEGNFKKWALDEDDAVSGAFDTYQSWIINDWELGGMGPGSLGSPLFNPDGYFVGLFHGGASSCDSETYSYFLKFDAVWDVLKEHLDPEDEGYINIAGVQPLAKPADESIVKRNIAIFPNPASNYLTLYNGNDEKITSVRFYSAFGQIVKQMQPESQVIDLSDLSPGMYILDIQLETFAVRKNLVISH